MALEAEELLSFFNQKHKPAKVFEYGLTITTAVVSVEDVARPRDVFTHSREHIPSRWLLTLECSSEMKVADGKQHEEEDLIAGEQTNNSFIAGEVAEFAMEILMARNYAQHALPNPATVSAKVSGMRRYLPYLPDVCFCVTRPRNRALSPQASTHPSCRNT